jgi:hypothetical protein
VGRQPFISPSPHPSRARKATLSHQCAITKRDTVQDLTPEKPAETKTDIGPAKRRDSWACIKKTLRIIGAIIGFLAALLTCLYYFGWILSILGLK